MKSKISLPWILLAVLTVLVTACLPSLPNAQPAGDSAALPIVDENIVSVTGMVVPEVSAALSVAAPGRVDQLLVMDGQTVQSGETLLTLSGQVQAEAAQAAAQVEVDAAQAALDDLDQNLDLARAAAWQTLLAARLQVFAAQDMWDEFTADDYQDDIEAAKDDMIDTQDDLKDAQETLDGYQDLAEDNATRKRAADDLEKAQEAYDDSVRSHEVLLLDQEVAGADLAAAQAHQSQAQIDYDALQAGPNPEQLDQAEGRLSAAQAQLKSAQDQLANLTLRAPFDGIVAGLNIGAHEWAAPGQPIGMLADLTTLRVETTDLTEIDVVKIKVGDTATISFDALPELSVSAVVTSIAPKASPGSGVNYTVTLAFEQLPSEILWGMTAYVDIALDR